MKSRVLIIGSGRRVQECFLPVFKVLAGHFELAGIHSRRREPLDEVARAWGVSSVYDLGSFDFSTVDVVVLSISKPSILPVLKALSPHAPSLTLVIDTPVLSRIQDYLHIGLLRRYKNVVVTEDFMNFPQFTFMRRLIAEDWIGEPRHVQLHHSGWSYHGLALIRSFFGFAHATQLSAVPVPGSKQNERVVSLKFTRGRTAVMADPYDFERGEFSVVGTRGTLSNVPMQGASASLLSTLYEDREFIGFRVSAPDGRRTDHLPEYLPALKRIEYRNKNEFNLQKNVGLVDVLLSIREENFNRRYSYLEGLYDHLLAKLAYTVGKWADPLAWVGKNILTVPDRLLGRIVS